MHYLERRQDRRNYHFCSLRHRAVLQLLNTGYNRLRIAKRESGWDKSGGVAAQIHGYPLNKGEKVWPFSGRGFSISEAWHALQYLHHFIPTWGRSESRSVIFILGLLDGSSTTRSLSIAEPASFLPVSFSTVDALLGPMTFDWALPLEEPLSPAPPKPSPGKSFWLENGSCRLLHEGVCGVFLWSWLLSHSTYPPLLSAHL